MDNIIIIRGGGDIATGIAHRLHRSGFKLIILEVGRPLVIRRTVAFAQAIFDREAIVEGVKAIMIEEDRDIYNIWRDNNIPILIDEHCEILDSIEPACIVDAILAKKNLGTNMNMASITIGIGPGFDAGKDVHAVVETNRGHDLGKVILDGFAEPNTGVPGLIMGYDKERVIKSPADGIIKNILEIGDMVKQGDTIATVNETPVKSTIDGVLRGLIMGGTTVNRGLKIADIDPRGIKEYCYTISEKARAIGGGVLEAILHLQNQGKRINGQ